MFERREEGRVNRGRGHDLPSELQVARCAGVVDNAVSKPRSTAARTVASTHMLVIIPQTRSSSTPAGLFELRRRDRERPSRDGGSPAREPAPSRSWCLGALRPGRQLHLEPPQRHASHSRVRQ